MLRVQDKCDCSVEFSSQNDVTNTLVVSSTRTNLREARFINLTPNTQYTMSLFYKDSQGRGSHVQELTVNTSAFGGMLHDPQLIIKIVYARSVFLALSIKVTLHLTLLYLKCKNFQRVIVTIHLEL